MSTDEPWQKKMEDLLRETRDGVIELRTEAKASWAPAARQTWRNKTKLDEMRGAVRGLGILVLVLTVFSLVLGIVQAVRAFGGS